MFFKKIIAFFSIDNPVVSNPFVANMDQIVVLEDLPQSEVGAPLPHIFSNSYSTYVVYHVQEQNPVWDASTIEMLASKNTNEDLLAIVKFEMVQTHRFGVVNDEAIHGHRLYNKGLRAYTNHQIINSSWIEELRNIHLVHNNFSAKHWNLYNHYLLFFHDELFEVVARSYSYKLINSTLQKALLAITQDMFQE